MSAPVLLMLAAAALLGAAAALELLRGGGELPAAGSEGDTPGEDGRAPGAGPQGRPASPRPRFGGLATGAGGLEARLARAGLAGRLGLGSLLAAKGAGAALGAIVGLLAAPVAPGNLGLLALVGMPAGGWMAPDAWLEHRARARLRALSAALPDALDRLAVGASAGRSPLAGLGELGQGEGPLAAELAVLAAEASCGSPQRQALAGLRERVPIGEVAAMCGVIERSRRFGSPLAEQLSGQASSLRAAQRRRTAEHAARAAPKIQLAVALLLVPSVLLMIAAGLLANMDRFLAGL